MTNSLTMQFVSTSGLLPEPQSLQRQVQANHAHEGSHQRKALSLHSKSHLFIFSYIPWHQVDLSEFNVYDMTENNGAHQLLLMTQGMDCYKL